MPRHSAIGDERRGGAYKIGVRTTDNPLSLLPERPGRTGGYCSPDSP